MATVEFAVNKTGGRIMMMAPADDRLLVEAARVRLLETLAGLRRGDFRGVDVSHLDSPAAKELVRLRTRLRYAFRALPLGGEIVLLSEDHAVIAAIHQLLAARPAPIPLE